MTPPSGRAPSSDRGLPWAQARQVAFDAAETLLPVTLPLADAPERVLARPVLALSDVPHYASSAMDGWAVRGAGPWRLDGVVVSTGVTGARGLSLSEARAIVTGGLIPDGADAVLRSEAGSLETNGAESSAGGTILSSAEIPWPGQHMRPPGEEFHLGDVAIEAGVLLNPAHIAVAAACGVDELTVEPRARVSLVLTGDEVVTHGIPGPGQVRDSFGPQLPTFVRMLGGDAVRQARVGDDHDVLRRALEVEAGASEVIITTGGTGSSSADHLRRVLTALDARILVEGVAMRPGGPSLLARLADGRFLIGLPGNPLAAMMGLLTLAEPLLAGLAGSQPARLSRVRVAEAVPPGRGATRLIPFRFRDGRAEPSAFTGSAMLRGLAGAAGVLVCGPEGLAVDADAEFLRLPWS